MINIKDLVQNKDKYLTGFKNKGLDIEDKVDEVISLQNKLTPLLTKEGEVRAELNNISKEIIFIIICKMNNSCNKTY